MIDFDKFIFYENSEIKMGGIAEFSICNGISLGWDGDDLDKSHPNFKAGNLYGKFLKYDAKNSNWKDRDYFILSKGHGSLALYVTLEKYGFFNKNGLEKKILGGHPDCNKVNGAEASTGSLGHGICTAAGLALGLKIKQKKNKVITLIGDGESNEGTIWETALVASNLKLGNFLNTSED